MCIMYNMVHTRMLASLRHLYFEKKFRYFESVLSKEWSETRKINISSLKT